MLEVIISLFDAAIKRSVRRAALRNEMQRRAEKREAQW